MANTTVCNYASMADTKVNNRTAFSEVDSEGQREVDFRAVISEPRASVAAAVSPGTALTVANFQDAMNNTLLVTRSAAAASILTVGADTSANAKALIAMFNLTSTSVYRVIRFTALTTDATYSVSLANTSGTSTFVQILLDGAAAGATQLVFSTNVAPPTASSGQCGVTRTVLVNATSVTAGSEVVQFNVLSIGA